MRNLILSLLIMMCLCILSPAQTQEQTTQDQVATPEIPQKTVLTYDRAGRRDPFRDLLEGRDIQEESDSENGPRMTIADIILIGIIEMKGGFTAIVNGPQGFPYYLKKGDRLADGYILSIEANQVIFRQTRSRGISLFKARNITKEINPEER